MINTIQWKNNSIEIIDQRLLPTEYKLIQLNTIESVWDAIKTLAVRGAPAIGVAAAYGVLLAMKNFVCDTKEDYLKELDRVIDYLATSRPTAVNLFWAMEKLRSQTIAEGKTTPEEITAVLEEKAHAIFEEDLSMGKAIGEFGNDLIECGDTILTHCNAGGLATSGMGTALAPIFTANDVGKKIKVFADETRPLLQGSRLTAWELMQENIDVTLICDNMAGFSMKLGKIDKVIVGADRITANGDTANKIGTYTVAAMAKRNNIPFYVAAPSSTFDLSLENGDQIPIEEREAEEITCGFGKQTAPDNVKVYSPAFDVTENELVTAFITEKGVIYPPFKENISKIFSSDK